MDASQFTIWLQGFAELNSAPPTPEQWQSIRNHLALVFKKVTPPLGSPKIPDMKEAIKEMIERAEKEKFVPMPMVPHQPYYLRDGASDYKFPPDILIC